MRRKTNRVEHKQRKGKTKTLKKKQKQAIVKRLLPITVGQAMQDWPKLRALTCPQIKQMSARTTLGNHMVDVFTMIERLHTKGHQGIDFYEFWQDRAFYAKKPYVAKMIQFYKSRNIDEIRKYKYIYNLYFSSIAIFRPVMAMEVYCRVKAKRVLDFTMGWGGRLVGGCAFGLEAYYGIDRNVHLKTPYTAMVKALQTHDDMHTNIELQFQDALTIDYAAYNYDTVFTSPPYYDLETYRNSKDYKNREEWHEKFYTPLLQRTYQHLQSGGHYCLNVPIEIYKAACVPVLGTCTFRIPLKKGERNLNKKYHEYVYVWKKDKINL